MTNTTTVSLNKLNAQNYKYFKKNIQKFYEAKASFDAIVNFMDCNFDDDYETIVHKLIYYSVDELCEEYDCCDAYIIAAKKHYEKQAKYFRLLSLTFNLSYNELEALEYYIYPFLNISSTYQEFVDVLSQFNK